MRNPENRSVILQEICKWKEHIFLTFQKSEFLEKSTVPIA